MASTVNDDFLDATNQLDKFDEDEWSDDGNEPQKPNATSDDEGITKSENEENHPPPNTYKKINVPSTIPEESRSNYSSYRQSLYSQQSSKKDSVKSSHHPETYMSTYHAASVVPETRKDSISFDSKSFGRRDEFERTLKRKEEEERRKRTSLHSRQNITHDSNNPATSVSVAYLYSTPPSSKFIREPLRPRCLFPNDSTTESKKLTSVLPDSSTNCTNTTLKTIPYKPSKPLTSTPKSAERNLNRFDAGISEIHEKSKNVSNSSLSTSKLRSLINEIDLNQSSFRNAQNYVRRIPKTSQILEDLKRKRAMNDSSNNSKLNRTNVKPQHQHRQTSILPVPALPPVHEHHSFPNRPSTSSSSDAVEIAIKPEPLSHWGFVAIGEEVESKIYVRNELSHIIEIIPNLRNRSLTSSFKLATTNAVQIHPHCSHELSVVFAPTKCAKFHDYVQFYVASSGKTYNHKVFGYGGTCDVKITEKRFLSYFPLSGLYRFAPPHLSTFEFQVENTGERTAFVHVAAFDVNGFEARSITVSPQSFCIESKNLETSSKEIITVKIPENYIHELRRMSMESLASASSVKKNYVFTLRVIFGDERLRQRAKVYCDDVNRHEVFQGLFLTQIPFLLNGVAARTVDCEGTSIQDLEMLKCQTRALTILVGDDRTSKPSTKSLSSRPPSSLSHRGILDNGFYVPECNKECDSTFLSVADSDRTFMR